MGNFKGTNVRPVRLEQDRIHQNKSLQEEKTEGYLLFLNVSRGSNMKDSKGMDLI